MSSLGLVILAVDDYDEAVAIHTGRLGFVLWEDTVLGDGKRWGVVQPRRVRETALLLSRAATSHQRTRVGDQTGGRAGMFLSTDDFDHDYRRLTAAGVMFETAPRHEPWGDGRGLPRTPRKPMGLDRVVPVSWSSRGTCYSC
ncbi:VOC family protein [Actinopolyspora erythraea]|uniref:VOC family protein n=1 Tax=Actinopolyspora erythraea TaxID=414996 RepID=UPI001C129420|nr:VOC family protein [Actinopolyspora erythraea]